VFRVKVSLVCRRLRTKYTLHGLASCLDAQFCFPQTRFVKRITSLHKFSEHDIHCTSPCFISFVCNRVSSHKSSWLLEVTSHVNSCRVVTTLRHISNPHWLSMSISGVCSQTSCSVCQLPVRMSSWISPHDFCQDDSSTHRVDSTRFGCIGHLCLAL